MTNNQNQLEKSLFEQNGFRPSPKFHGLLQEQRTKVINQIFDAYEQGVNKDIHCTDWGSCQYSNAYYTYHWALALMQNMGLEVFEKSLGITRDYILTKAEFIAYLQKILHENSDEKPKLLTIEDYFEFAKDHSWDLWSAAEYPFGNFECSKKPELPTFGPLLNTLVQNENFDTGLSCAYITFIYGAPETCFMDFDT